MFMFRYLTVLYLSVGVCFTQKNHHTFSASTNFDNPSRWTDAKKGYPCAGDTIKFRGDQVISSFVQTDLSISEVILPQNGEFIFDKEVTWGVSERLSICFSADHSTVVHYSSEPDAWYNPGNWEVRNSVGKLLGLQDLLDIEKTPCLYDDAAFPVTNSFTSYMSLDAEVASLFLTGKFFDTTGFVKYRASDGRYQFTGDGEVKIDSNGCEDETGCLCRSRNNLQPTLKEICSSLQCIKSSCKNPIRAAGSCCWQCGAIITFNYTQSYREQKMREHLETLMSDPQYDGVHAVLSKVSEEMLLQPDVESYGLPGSLPLGEPTIQILITDEESGIKSGAIAKELAYDLFDELSKKDNSLGVATITEQISGDGTSSSMEARTIVGIVLGSILALLLLLGLAAVCARRISIHGKKYNMTLQLFDADPHAPGIFPTVTEVGPGPEFESTDDKPNFPESNGYKSTVEDIGLPQASAMYSDFGVSFGNPTFDSDSL